MTDPRWGTDSIPWTWCEDLASGPTMKPTDFWPDDRFDLVRVDDQTQVLLVHPFNGREIARIACETCDSRLGGIVDGPYGPTLWLVQVDRHARCGADCRSWRHRTEPGEDARRNTTVKVAFRFMDPLPDLVVKGTVARMREPLADSEFCTAFCSKSRTTYLSYVRGSTLRSAVDRYRASGRRQSVGAKHGNPWRLHSA